MILESNQIQVFQDYRESMLPEIIGASVASGQVGSDPLQHPFWRPVLIGTFTGVMVWASTQILGKVFGGKRR